MSVFMGFGVVVVVVVDPLMSCLYGSVCESFFVRNPTTHKS